MTLIKGIFVGGAGNTAGIDTLEQGVLPEDRVLLVNSTDRDLPEQYKSKVVLLTDTCSGAGKERKIGKDLCLESLNEGRLSKVLDHYVGDDIETEQYVVVGSSEGGTGSAIASIIAKYIEVVYGRKVQQFVFTGDEQDTRSIQNTIEYFQDIPSDNITVQAISNKKFLEEANNNLIKAEKLANMEFLTRLSIMMGLGMVDSSKTIDDKDLNKLVCTGGYMVVGHQNLVKIKNVEQYNKVVLSMIDDNKSLETNKSAGRLGIIINASDETQDCIDYTWKAFKDKFGNPYEVFTHIQYDNSQPEYISFIASGLNLPLDILKETFERYKIESEKVNKKKDDFFNFISDIKGNSEDDKFNTDTFDLIAGGADIKNGKKAFFDDFNKTVVQEKVENPQGIKDVTVNELNKKKKDFLKNNY